MDAVTLPAINATPAPAGAKATVDPRQETGFSDAMVAATEPTPTPSGGRFHISPIFARPSTGNAGNVRDAHGRDATRDGKQPSKSGLPGSPGAPGKDIGRLARTRPGSNGDAGDSLRARGNDRDTDDGDAADIVAGMLAILPGSTAAAIAGRPGAANAKTARAGARDAVAGRAPKSDDVKAKPDTRKPADAGAQTGASRYQLQRLQQAASAGAQDATANATRTPADSAARSKHLAAQATTPANTAAAGLGATATHTDAGTAPASPGTLPGSGSIAALNGSAAATATASASATLSSPIGSAAWPHELGQQLVQMVQRGIGQIDLHLNPRELGPVQISLHLHDQTAQVHFLVAHADVQQTVQQALPQLRDALAGQGIALGDALVGQQQQQPSGSFGGSADSPSWSGPATDIDDAAPVRTTTIVMPQGPGSGVDLYA